MKATTLLGTTGMLTVAVMGSAIAAGAAPVERHQRSRALRVQVGPECYSKHRRSPKSEVSWRLEANCQRTVRARRKVAAVCPVKVSCRLCTSLCTAQDCGLTLPSRGQLPGYAL